jgi:hypothetical protein
MTRRNHSRCENNQTRVQEKPFTGTFSVSNTVSEGLFYRMQFRFEYNFAPHKSLEESVVAKSGL